jgi:hypothetical protein
VYRSCGAFAVSRLPTRRPVLGRHGANSFCFRRALVLRVRGQEILISRNRFSWTALYQSDVAELQLARARTRPQTAGTAGDRVVICPYLVGFDGAALMVQAHG